MLIGNRRRPQMQRTTSISRFAVDVDDDQAPTGGQNSDVTMAPVVAGDGSNYDQRFLAMFSPRNQIKEEEKSSSSLSSSFLVKCGFCKCRLASGRDIYMYKGDAAFCSMECREQQIELDEGKTQNEVVPSSSN